MATRSCQPNPGALSLTSDGSSNHSGTVVSWEKLLEVPGVRLRPPVIDLVEVNRKVTRQGPIILQSPISLPSGANEYDFTGKQLEHIKAVPAQISVQAKTTPELFANSIRIGAWEEVAMYLTQIQVKFNHRSRKLIWEILKDGLKRKVEIHFGAVDYLQATYPMNAPCTLELEVTFATFHEEVDVQPGKSATWAKIEDFTGGADVAATPAGSMPAAYTRHLLTFPEGTLRWHLDHLLRSDPALKKKTEKKVVHVPLLRPLAEIPASIPGVVHQRTHAAGGCQLMDRACRYAQVALAERRRDHSLEDIDFEPGLHKDSNRQVDMATAVHLHSVPGPFWTPLPPSPYEKGDRALALSARASYYYAAGPQQYDTLFHPPDNSSLSQVVSQVAAHWDSQVAEPAVSVYPPQQRKFVASPLLTSSAPSRCWGMPRTGSAAASTGGSSTCALGGPIPRPRKKRAALHPECSQPPPARRARGEKRTVPQVQIIMPQAGEENRYATIADKVEAVAIAPTQVAAREAEEAAAFPAAMAAVTPEARAAGGLSSGNYGVRSVFTWEAAGALPESAIHGGEIAAIGGIKGAATGMPNSQADLLRAHKDLETWNRGIGEDQEIDILTGIDHLPDEHIYALSGELTTLPSLDFPAPQGQIDNAALVPGSYDFFMDFNDPPNYDTSAGRFFPFAALVTVAPAASSGHLPNSISHAWQPTGESESIKI